MGIGSFFRREPLSKSPLGLWIAENRPDLDRELSLLLAPKALAVLNRETGLQVDGSESIVDTLPLFLEELKKKQGNTN